MNKDPSFSHSLYAINTLKDKIVFLLITHNKEKETEIPIIYYVLDLNLQKRKQRLRKIIQMRNAFTDSRTRWSLYERTSTNRPGAERKKHKAAANPTTFVNKKSYIADTDSKSSKIIAFTITDIEKDRPI